MQDCCNKVEKASHELMQPNRVGATLGAYTVGQMIQVLRVWGHN